MNSKPDLESNLARLLRLFGKLPDPVREFRFHTTRRWRLDFAWPEKKLGIEIQGGTFMRGPSGHTSASGVQRDCEKSNALTQLGWRCLRYTTTDLNSRPIQVVEEITAEYHRT